MMKRIIPVLLLGLFVALNGLCHTRLFDRRSHFPEEEDILYLPKVSALSAMSLGHHELAASMIFVRATVYFGGEMATKGKLYTFLDNYLDTIVTLDPQFELAYRWAGTATMYNGRSVTNDMVKRANHYLILGNQHFPQSWQFPWMIGCNYMFELQAKDAKEKQELQRIGADWIRQAALLGSSPAWAALLAAQIMRKEGKSEASVRYLEEVYLTTNDDQTREEIRKRLLSLRSQVAAQKLEREVGDFKKGFQATLPYAHPDLFVLLGPRPDKRMDPEWIGRNQVLIEAQKSEEAFQKERDETVAAPK